MFPSSMIVDCPLLCQILWEFYTLCSCTTEILQVWFHTTAEQQMLQSRSNEFFLASQCI